MVRASKKIENGDDERTRLKKLAISRNLLSQTPLKPISFLNPSKTVLKHHGKDIIKKSQRKNKYLFSFPGLLGPLKGGKIGELKDLGTKNPILYLDFPQGQVKLFGTIVYTKNRYLTLQFSKGGKNVMCEDHFDNMVVFSDAWWIGRKDENPDEVQLEFPKNLIEGTHTDCDFKGGAGATCKQKLGANKPRKEYAEPLSPITDLENVSEDSSSLTGKTKDLMDVTPVRQSARTAGKTFKFAEASSGDDSDGSGSDTSEVNTKGDKEKLDGVTEDSSLVVHAIDSVDVAARTDLLGQNQESSFSVKSKDSSLGKRGLLVQATISTLFEKVEGKKSTKSAKNSSTPKDHVQKLRQIDSGQKNDQAKGEGPRKEGTPIKGRKSGRGGNTKKKQSQDEDDDIEDCSTESEDIDESDEDWTV